MSIPPPSRPPPHRALTWALINQLATPGLGSLMGRRFVAGTGQLLLALAGFTLITAWMFHFFGRAILEQMGESPPPDSPDRRWAWGLWLFGASWCWSLVTSISLLRQSRNQPPGELSPAIPNPPARGSGHSPPNQAES